MNNINDIADKFPCDDVWENVLSIKTYKHSM